MHMVRISQIISAFLIVSTVMIFSPPYPLASAAACGFGSSITGGLCRGYLTSGTTWSVPSDWRSSGAIIECVGPGGNGASTHPGAGGQGGGYGKVTSPSNISAGDSLSVQVGTGGSTSATFLKNNLATTICQGDYGGTSTTGAANNRTQTNIGTTLTSAGGNGASGSFSGGGGGGAGGPTGIGKNGGAAGGGGGTGGGASAGGGNGTGGGGTNGKGGGATFNGTPGGSGGTPGGSGSGDTSGGSGGGGGTTGAGGNGGKGGDGQEWDSTHGTGGGGGGGGGNANSTNGGNGGLYGGGGAGAGGGTGGTGGQGIIVITYTPLAFTPGAPFSLSKLKLFGGTFRIMGGFLRIQ